MNYRFLENVAVADIAFEAYGKNYVELFKNSALALTDCMVNLKDVKPKIKKTIKLKYLKIEDLLFNFLSELIYIKDVNLILFNKFSIKVKKNKVYELICYCYGDKINPKTQDLRNDVKAVTVHMFEIKKIKDKYKATVVLDV